MSYTVQPPPVVAPPAPAVAPEPRRPVPVTFAAAVLALMALVGLAYAIAAIATAPGTVDRFRAAAVGAAGTDVDGYVDVIWIGAAIGTVLAVILFALYVVLALGLRRGSNAARIATWAVCGLGLLAGCGSTVTVLVQRSGTGDPQSLGAALSDSYPNSWIGLNLSLAIAQVIGYAVVALLLLAGRGAWFGRGRATPGAEAGPQPGYGALGYGTPGYGAGYGPSPAGAPGYGPPGTGAPGYYAPGPGYSYGAPYVQAQPSASGQGYPTDADRAYQPGGGQEWAAPAAQDTGSAPTPGQPSPGADPQQPGQPSGMPPVPPGQAPGQFPANPSEAPQQGPDDEYWSRPSS